jgi:lysozyme
MEIKLAHLPNLKKASLRNLLAAGVVGAMALTTAFVGHYEGRVMRAYLDPAGVPTICNGATKGVRLGQTASGAECDAMLERDVKEALRAVDRAVKVPLPETRRAALGSFVYNVGEGRFKKSTLLKKLNAGDTIGACNELSRYIFAGGKKLKGLVTRREAERELCLRGAR